MFDPTEVAKQQCLLMGRIVSGIVLAFMVAAICHTVKRIVVWARFRREFPRVSR